MVEVRGGRQCTRETPPSALLSLVCRTYPFLRTMAGEECEMLWNEGQPNPYPQGGVDQQWKSPLLLLFTVSLLIQVSFQPPWLMFALGNLGIRARMGPVDWGCTRVSLGGKL